jgi:hypothetical protein
LPERRMQRFVNKICKQHDWFCGETTGGGRPTAFSDGITNESDRRKPEERRNQADE